MVAPDVQRFLAACLQPCWIVSVSSLTEYLGELVEHKAAMAPDAQRNTKMKFDLSCRSVAIYYICGRKEAAPASRSRNRFDLLA
jgi:hypothetical protein